MDEYVEVWTQQVTGVAGGFAGRDAHGWAEISAQSASALRFRKQLARIRSEQRAALLKNKKSDLKKKKKKEGPF